ncbi:hypothetical protein [Ensifer soli]|uniref:hypothetical protein n=1 Tax=Ciceribacter sp. sgz301302 TaxID=3342379 RepID=UPI0035BA06F1
MTRAISLTKRKSDDAETSGDVEVFLLHITHPEMEETVRLSSDDTVRISHDPLLYATHSTWLTANPYADPYMFMPMTVDRPHDQKGVQASATLRMPNISAEMERILRSVRSRSTVDIAVVMASDPNYVQDQVLGLKLVDHLISATEISLSISRAWKGDEPWPSGRMTQFVLPGLHL